MVDLERLLVCPRCRVALAWSSSSALCARCGTVFQLEDGIPVLVLDGAAHDLQVRFFDEEVDEEFEISRPHGAPALYEWVLSEKFRRSVAGFGSLLSGATVLSVCAGSGMDADFLAQAGADVITVDVSLGAARRARERAQRYRLRITPVVADIQSLPFADRSVDVTYVHDGLHHLTDPARGLAEMARVADKAVSVTEPARAAVTRLAIGLGIAGEFEDAGNRVMRVTLDEVSAELRHRGFQVVRAERYGMFYRHAPKAPALLLSKPGFFPLATTAIRLGNALAGRLGNKLTVQAIRAGGAGA